LSGLTLIACTLVLTALAATPAAANRIAILPRPAHGPLQEAGADGEAEKTGELESSEPPPPTEAALTAEDRETLDFVRFVLAKEGRESARELLRELVAGLESPADGAEAARVTFLIELSRFAQELGSLQESLALRRSILELCMRLHPPDSTALLKAKGDLAEAMFDLGDVAGAHELFESLLDAWTRILPPDHPDLIRSKQALAWTKFELGDLAGARELQEAVLEARTCLLHPDNRELLAAKSNLALTRRGLGDLAGALELEESVLEVLGRLLSPDHPDLLMAKGNLAATRSELGDLAGARELEEAVLQARRRLLPSDHPYLLMTMQNLAITRRELGDLAGALELEEAVLEARARLLSPNDLQLLIAKQNLAATRKNLGDLEGARELEEAVLEARASLLPLDHPDLLKAKWNLAATRSALGDAAGAHGLVSNLLESLRSRAHTRRAESMRASRESARTDLRLLSEVISLCTSADFELDLEPALFATLESLRLASVASAEAAHALAEHPELAALAARAAASRTRLNDLSLDKPELEAGEESEDGTVESWRRTLLQLAEERDLVERELRVKLAETGTFVGEIDAPTLGSRLVAGSATVSFLKYVRHFDTGPATGKNQPSVDSLLAFVVRAGGSVRRIDLGAAAELETLVHDWREALGRPLQGRGIGVAEATSEEKRLDGAGRRLRERVLDPVLAGMEDVRELHVELDDLLYLVPLDALPLEGGLVGERIAIRNEVTLARLLRSDPEVASDGCLALAGGIDYDAELGEETRARLDAATPPLEAGADPSRAGLAGFLPLPGTAEETAAIAKLYAGVSEREATVLTAASATKAALHAAAPRTRFLHVATHGWFASESFKSQLDTLAERGARDPWQRVEETLTGFAPETLCGLALAGANRGKDALGRVPGILTAEELATFDLRNCELAVLSACETNVGIRRAGQGIQSLQTALHAAGARTAITSLWKVDDAATRRLFELFYAKLWRSKLGKADALWQAKMALRAEGHPPRDWAGWVLSGDPD